MLSRKVEGQRSKVPKRLFHLNLRPSTFDLGPSTGRNESVEISVCRKSQELDKRLTLHQAIQNFPRFAQTARGFAAELGQLFPPNLPVGVERDRGAIGQARASVNPLPEL